MTATESYANPFVCHECDALQDVSGVEPGNSAICVCCGNTLFKQPVGGVDKPLALVLAAAMLFIVANIFPIMQINISGLKGAATLTGTAMAFIKVGAPEMAFIVWVPSVFIPGFIVFGMLYVLISIRFGLALPATKFFLAWVSHLLPWAMLDVFLLGVLVGLVKLVALADVLLGPGFYALVAFIFTYAAASATLEPHVFWEWLDKAPDEQRELCHER
jgi:paraquat-inducible protein A